MKKIIYLGYTLAFLLIVGACEQDRISLTDPEPDLTNVSNDPCSADADPGSADFTKYVAIGNSITAGYQAGALFTGGQENSLGAILATQFACVGGGTFNQPSINSELGFFTGGQNPLPNNTVLGRLLLQGTPPSPAPTISNDGAIPSPLNPGFVYSGDKDALNNFAVPGIQIGQIFITETGDWTKYDLDPDTPGPQPDPRFNPFYARFAKAPGTSTILIDAMGALANGGTFFSFWLGSNDILGYALTGAANPTIFTSEEDFTMRFNGAVATLLSVEDVKGVVGNIPDVTIFPYFRLVPYNAIPLPAENAAALNAGFAGYNNILDALKGAPFNLPAAEMDARKVAFEAGQNKVVLIDEELTDLGPYFDMLEGAEQITTEQRAQLEPYRMIRQAGPTDLLTLTAATVLGTTVGGNPLAIQGLTVPLGDQYVLTPEEQTEIRARTTAFNTIISTTVSGSDRLALADVYTKYLGLVTSQVELINGVTFAPTMPPPFGGFSEDGVHPNARGTAYVANIFINAINAKFGAKVPLVNLAKYGGTALPINP